MTMRPVDLSQQQTTIARRGANAWQRPVLQPGGTSRLPPQEEREAKMASAPHSNAAGRGMVEALNHTMRPLEGGGWGEALARFGESYIRARSARDQYQREEFLENDERNREQKQQERRSTGIAEALAAGADLSGSERDSAMAQALASYGQTDDAFELVTRPRPSGSLTPEQERVIAALPPDQQGLARINPQAFVSGIMRHRFPAPRQQGGGDFGDDWEAF